MPVLLSTAAPCAGRTVGIAIRGYLRGKGSERKSSRQFCRRFKASACCFCIVGRQTREGSGARTTEGLEERDAGTLTCPSRFRCQYCRIQVALFAGSRYGINSLECVHHAPCTLQRPRRGNSALHALHRGRSRIFSQKVNYLGVCRPLYAFSMTHCPDRVATYSGCLPNLALGKAGQLTENLGTCRDTPIFVDLALEFDAVIHRALLQFALEFLPAISMLTCRDGGHIAAMDTDSAMIVSTRDGGFVPCAGGPHRLEEFQAGSGHDAIQALSWAQVDRIRDRFEALNPWRDTLGVPFLRLEKENFSSDGERQQLYADCVSAKLYCLFNLDDNGLV